MKQTYLRFLFLLVFPLLSSANLLHAQGFGLPPGFDLKTFQKNEEQALWFLQYDTAWQYVAAFDHLPAGKDFICYPDKRGWKVVAGTVDSAGFQRDAAYYQLDSKYSVTASKKKFDTVQVNAMGRALYNANAALKKLAAKPAGGWRKFVKVNPDQSITVWAFCDADASGSIWYGPECAWYFAADGRKINTSKIVNKAPLTAGKGPQSLNLSCPTDKMPTVGTIWLAHKYMKNFQEINVSYKTGVSTLRFNAAEKTYAWEHTAT